MYDVGSVARCFDDAGPINAKLGFPGLVQVLVQPTIRLWTFQSLPEWDMYAPLVDDLNCSSDIHTFYNPSLTLRVVHQKRKLSGE